MGAALKPAVRASRGRKEPPARPAQRFVDFSIRAWLEGRSVGVIAHASPVGSMRSPQFVRIGDFDAREYRLRLRAGWGEAATLGRELARWLLPPPVWGLLGDSLRALFALPGSGLRLRLCLADELIDLPWELLYRPDVTDPARPRSGFLLMDSRLSLVREPPTLLARAEPVARPQRGLFVGTLWSDGTDGWAVKQEFRSLKRSLAPLADLVQIENVHAHDAVGVQTQFARGCDFFHYAGHVDIDGSEASLVTLVNPAFAQATDDQVLGGRFEHDANPPGWSRIERLAPALKRAGVRCAMLNACNSGFWPVAQPFLRAGIGCLVGIQGLVSNIAALNFAEKLYRSLPLGLSVDEAASWARLHVMDDSRSWWDCDWARFMVYMPAESAVLFPSARLADLDGRRKAAVKERAETARRTRRSALRHDAESFQRQLSDMTEVSVLILGRFTDQRKAVLDDLRRALTQLDRGYVPILFDFDKAPERDLIESVLRFASVSRFIIADLSDPKSVPAELQAIVPAFPSVPVIAIIDDAQREYPVSDHILRMGSVLKPVVRYRNPEHLQQIFRREILEPAERLVAELRPPLLV
jgi:CHAT domain